MEKRKSLKSWIIKQAVPQDIFMLAIIVLATMLWGWIGLVASIIFTSLVMITYIAMTIK